MKVIFSLQSRGGLSPDQENQFALVTRQWLSKTATMIPLPSNLVFTVIASPMDYDATGLGGYTRNKTSVDLSLTTKRFDLALTTGIPTALSHECHHVARGYYGDTWRGSAIEAAVAEGLASVFEFEVSGIQTPMSQYPPEVKNWVSELNNLGSNWDYQKWFTRPNKGRYYVGYKVGRYIVDRAIKRFPDQSAASLVTTPASKILSMAGVTK